MSSVSSERGHALTVSAPAKINLTLEVLGKRPDGYHEIASVIQTIDLVDTLTFTPAAQITFNCDVKGLCGPDNLVLQAANMLREELGMEEGASIHLGKRIPVAAGLGGGSSDAAAALKGLNSLWGLELSIDQMLPLASRLGSDVPFFLYGGAVLVEGRGERLSRLPPIQQQWVVVAVPPHPVLNKTATLYGKLTSTKYTSGQATRELADKLRSRGEVDPSSLFNVFESVAYDVFPLLRDNRAWLLNLGMGAVHLSGTGPSLYAMVDVEQGERIRAALAKQGVEAYLVRTWGPDPEADPVT